MITELNDKITPLQTAAAGTSIVFMTEKKRLQRWFSDISKKQENTTKTIPNLKKKKKKDIFLLVTLLPEQVIQNRV